MLHALRCAGAEPIVAPMIRLAPPEDPSALDTALDALASGGVYDAVVFASGNAVRFVCARANERGLALDKTESRIVCGGPLTARAALEAGLPVHLVPPASAGAGDARTLLGEIERQLAPTGLHFLLPRSQIGRDELRDGLLAAGARVTAVEAYQTLPPDDGIEGDVAAQLRSGALGVLSFTSPSTVRNLVDRLDAGAREALGAALVAAVGPTTAKACRALGIEPAVVPEKPGGVALVEALAVWARANSAAIERIRHRQDAAQRAAEQDGEKA
jgi:uroporphyrinogen-III synthase